MNIEELNQRLKDVAFEYLTDEQKMLAAYTAGYNDGLSRMAELNKPVDIDENELKDSAKPKLSRFLPEGWMWRKVVYENKSEWVAELPHSTPAKFVYVNHPKASWHKLRLRHPFESEGGGFQRLAPGDKLPDEAHFLEESGIVGWRPPFQQIEVE